MVAICENAPAESNRDKMLFPAIKRSPEASSTYQARPHNLPRSSRRSNPSSPSPHDAGNQQRLRIHAPHRIIQTIRKKKISSEIGRKISVRRCKIKLRQIRRPAVTQRSAAAVPGNNLQRAIRKSAPIRRNPQVRRNAINTILSREVNAPCSVRSQSADRKSARESPHGASRVNPA